MIEKYFWLTNCLQLFILINKQLCDKMYEGAKMKKTVICKSICLLIILSIFSSCLFATIVCAEENRTSSIKSTEELLEEVLNHSKLQAPSLYNSFELYIDIFESSIPSRNFF